MRLLELFEELSNTIRCKLCGRNSPNDAQICRTCGNKLQQRKATPTIPTATAAPTPLSTPAPSTPIRGAENSTYLIHASITTLVTSARDVYNIIDHNNGRIIYYMSICNRLELVALFANSQDYLVVEKALPVFGTITQIPYFPKNEQWDRYIKEYQDSFKPWSQHNRFQAFANYKSPAQKTP
jgi:ribosomal protein L40E